MPAFGPRSDLAGSCKARCSALLPVRPRAGLRCYVDAVAVPRTVLRWQSGQPDVLLRLLAARSLTLAPLSRRSHSAARISRAAALCPRVVTRTPPLVPSSPFTRGQTTFRFSAVSTVNLIWHQHASRPPFSRSSLRPARRRQLRSNPWLIKHSVTGSSAAVGWLLV